MLPEGSIRIDQHVCTSRILSRKIVKSYSSEKFQIAMRDIEIPMDDVTGDPGDQEGRRCLVAAQITAVNVGF